MHSFNYLDRDQKIFIAGGNGMVGSAIARRLKNEGFQNILTPSRQELDLTDQRGVQEYFKNHLPDVVIMAAAKVGGIYANMTYPADFLYDNLIIECNVIHQAHLANINRLLFLGSTCIYPKFASQPISEESLLAGPLELTNEAYAIAKIAGVKLCYYYSKQYGRNYISAMPTNLYGPKDNYHPHNAHVLPALLRRFHEAKVQNLPEVVLWGTGNVMREFLHVDDLAEACVFLLKHYNEPSHVNIGSHEEISIRNLAELIKEVVGYNGEIVNDISKPDGTPRKKTDISKITSLGWNPKIPLEKGLKLTYNDFLEQGVHIREK